MKIIIIGGGIAGLSTAFSLCQESELDIEIYEKDDDIGGQARSQYGERCFTEYSWRIFGESYDNINHIVKAIGADKFFAPLKYPCIIKNDQIDDGSLNATNLLYQIYNSSDDLEAVDRLLKMSMMCKDRAINDYDHIHAYHYFNKNPIVQTILGPYLGLEANKVSLSGFMKNVYSTTTHNSISKCGTRITKHPTQQSLFDPWKKYLLSKGVKIFTNTEMSDIIMRDNIIQSVVMNGVEKKADEFIFALSLPGLLSASHNISHLPTISNLTKLLPCLQLYFTINLYFSEEIGSLDADKGSKSYCSELVIVDEDLPWKPIIQKKRLWKNNYLNKCDEKIKDVWNVGFLDYNVGMRHKKYLRQCSKQEAIEEGIYQLKQSGYIKNMMGDKDFDDLLIGIEVWYQFVNDRNNKLVSLNPKFSTNVNSQKYMPNTTSSDLPSNMYLSGYYVQSSMGGVSMESSCETGLSAAEAVLEKLGKKSNLPYIHNNEYIHSLVVPFAMTDKLLYSAGVPPLTDAISPLLLIIICFILLVLIVVCAHKYANL